jgi:hypothetical protein
VYCADVDSLAQEHEGVFGAGMRGEERRQLFVHLGRSLRNACSRSLSDTVALILQQSVGKDIRAGLSS